MTLKTAARIELAIMILFAILCFPLVLVTRPVFFLNEVVGGFVDKAYWRIGNKLLLRSKEFKDGRYPNPIVKEWTALKLYKFNQRWQ